MAGALVINPIIGIIADVALGAVQLALDAQQLQKRAVAGEPVTIEDVQALEAKADALRERNRRAVEELLGPAPPAAA